MGKVKDNESIVSEQYVKSNVLISATYRSSLLANKIMAIALANIKDAKVEESGKVISTLNATDLIKLMGANRGSFYSQLDKAANQMTGKTIGVSDPDLGYFDYIAVITRCTYDDGKLRIEWNDALKSKLLELSSNFTVLNIGTMLSFESVYSFRLYELLKSNAYNHKYRQTNENGEVTIEYSLSELKLNLGVINAELDSVRTILRSKKDPDFDKAVAASPERMFDDWRDFRKKVILVGVDEINEKTDLSVRFDPVKVGKGGKVSAVNFFVKHKEFAKAEEKKSDRTEEKTVRPKAVMISDAEKFEIIAKVKDLIEEDLEIKDIVSICEAAEYSFEKISGVYEVARATKTVNSMTAFMIAGIKNDYTAPVKARKGSKKTGKADFEQRKYNFDELEKELLA